MNSSPYSYMTAPDGLKIRIGHWPALFKKVVNGKTRTMVVMQGRASFMEKFEEVIRQLQEQGFDVWALDWRGQGLSSRILGNHHKGHIDSYETYLQDLHQLVTTYIKPDESQELIAMGQSMGGHLALRYLGENPGIMSGGILACPMLDIKTGAYPRKMARWIARMINRAGMGENYIFGHGNFDPNEEPFEGNYLTHDRERFYSHRVMQVRNPELVLGGATFGWLDASFKSIERIMQQTYLQSITVPVLMVEAGEDDLVENAPFSYIASHLPQCEYRLYPDARHQLFMEADDILERFWGDFNGFMRTYFDTNPALAAAPVTVRH